MRDEVLELLNDVFPAIDFLASDTLVDDGTLSSLNIVQIVSELAMEFDVEFSFEDLTPENFNSIDAIAAMVERRRG